MCLVALAIDPDAPRPLVLAANRDEYHERPAEPAQWWTQRPGLLGGRDQRAGGSWLGVTAGGRFAVVLNDARRPRPAAAPSRGELVPGFLASADPAGWLRELATARGRYAGFHLVAGAGTTVHFVSSTTLEPMVLGAGLHVVDNTGPDAGTPRAQRALARLAGPLTAGGDGPALLTALGDRADPGRGDGDARPLFLDGAVFGTRSSTVLALATGPDARGELCERRYASGARFAGESRFVWPLAHAGPA